MTKTIDQIGQSLAAIELIYKLQTVELVKMQPLPILLRK